MTQDRESLSLKFASFMERRSGRIILAMVTLTIILAIPMFAMSPDEDASDSPGGADTPPRIDGI